MPPVATPPFKFDKLVTLIMYLGLYKLLLPFIFVYISCCLPVFVGCNSIKPTLKYDKLIHTSFRWHWRLLQKTLKDRRSNSKLESKQQTQTPFFSTHPLDPCLETGRVSQLLTHFTWHLRPFAKSLANLLTSLFPIRNTSNILQFGFEIYSTWQPWWGDTFFTLVCWPGFDKAFDRMWIATTDGEKAEIAMQAK